MRASTWLIASTFLVLCLAACSQDDRVGYSDGSGNVLLDHVPAETPYLAANLEPLPADVVDAHLLRLQPVIDEMQSQLSVTLEDLERAENTRTDPPPVEQRLGLALLRELDGKLSSSGLASLGLDVLSHKVVYGVGAFPVIRMGLSEPDALTSTIRRILESAEIPGAEQLFQGVSYWRIAPDPATDLPLALYLAIVEQHLAIGLLPFGYEAEWLPGFLALQPPAASDARHQLAELNRANRYTAYGSGILDLHRLADELLQPGSLTARVMAATGAYDPGSVSAECVAEVHQIIDNMPRLTAGTAEFGTDAIALQYRLESPAPLAAKLAALVSPVPEADAASQRLLDFSFGLRFGAVRDFLREKAGAISADPYGCDFLQDVNDSANRALVQLDQPMPPFINNFRGLRLSLSHADPGGDLAPQDARGHIALHVEQPEMFVGMAQMFLPDLSGLELKPGAEPIAVPASLTVVPDMVAFAAMTGDAIGLSLGAGEESGLLEFMGRDPGPEDMFLSASYDIPAYIEYSKKWSSTQHAGENGDPDATFGATQALGLTARGAMQDVAQRSLTTLRFGAGGLVIDERLTFR
jgi:hypothetical protein